MKPLLCSDDVIDAMADAVLGHDVAEHDREIFRESLRGLVRLARAEQLYSMQMDFNRMTAGPKARCGFIR